MWMNLLCFPDLSFWAINAFWMMPLFTTITLNHRTVTRLTTSTMELDSQFFYRHLIKNFCIAHSGISVWFGKVHFVNFVNFVNFLHFVHFVLFVHFVHFVHFVNFYTLYNVDFLDVQILQIIQILQIWKILWIWICLKARSHLVRIRLSRYSSDVTWSDWCTITPCFYTSCDYLPNLYIS